MRKAGGIIALIAGIFSIFAGFIVGGLLYSFLTIVLASIALGVNSRVPGILLVIFSLAGAILGKPLIAIFMVLSIIGGILVIIGGGKKKLSIPPIS